MIKTLEKNAALQQRVAGRFNPRDATRLLGQIVGCALFATSGPAFATAAPDAVAIVRLLADQDAAILRVSERLVIGGAALCGGSGRSAGMLIQTLGQYRTDLRSTAQAELGLDARPTITLIASGSAAEAAGLRPRDVIVAINSHTFASDGATKAKSFDGAKAAHDAIERALAGGTAQLDVERRGQRLRIALIGRPACRARFDVRSGPTSKLFGRFADAGSDYVRVRSELVSDTRGDGELAAIMAHEMAHLVLKHSDRRRASGARISEREAETEADRLSVYLMNAAGYAPADAIAFYTRWGPKNDLGVFSDGSHPGWQKRVAMLQAEATRIADLKAKGQPVLPPPDLGMPR